MPDASINIQIDQFTNLASGMSATMLVLLISLGLEKGDTLTINEVDSLNVATGNVGYGVIEKIASGEFYLLPDGYNQYYLNPFTLPTWVDYGALSTVTGWSSFTTKQIKYINIGQTVYWSCYIDGTSNSVNSIFTLPFTVATGMNNWVGVGRVIDAGAGSSQAGMSKIVSGACRVFLRLGLTDGGWTASGRKAFFGQGFFQKV